MSGMHRHRRRPLGNSTLDGRRFRPKSLQFMQLESRQMMAADFTGLDPAATATAAVMAVESTAPMGPFLEQAETAAAERADNKVKGVALVLLSSWSHASVHNFLQVATDANAPKTLEITFNPTLANNDDPYANALTLLYGDYVNGAQASGGMLAAGKTVNLVVQLGYHGKGSKLDESGDDHFDDRVNDFLEFVKKLPDSTSPYYWNVKLTLTPTLEDKYKSHSEFLAMARKIGDKLPFDVLRRVDFRRSPAPETVNAGAVSPGLSNLADSNPATPEKAALSKIAWKRVKLDHEYHGLLSDDDADQYQAYSNDGYFVWANIDSHDANRTNDESQQTADKTKNGDTGRPDDKQSLTNFIGEVKKQGRKSNLLWRPAYNLFRKDPPAAGSSADVGGYTKVGLANDRSDSETSPKFDDLEQVVLWRFFGRSNPIGQQTVTAVDDKQFTTVAGRAVGIDVLGNDTASPDSGIRVWNFEATTKHGTVSRDPANANRLIYTPAAGFVGSDTFRYYAAGSHSNLSSAVVKINVTNAAPTAASVDLVIENDSWLDIDALGLATDPDGHPLSLFDFAQPGSGHVQRDPANPGRLIYTPARDFIGLTGFDLHVTDPYGAQAAAHVSVRVVARPTVPAMPTDLRSDPPLRHSVRIYWNDAANNDQGYRVAISTDGVNFRKIAETERDATSAILRDLDPATRYWVRVRAFNDQGASDFTTPIEFVTQSGLPQAPVQLRNDPPDAHNVRIRWNNVAENASGYRVALSIDGVHFSNADVTGRDAQSSILRDLQPGTRYWVRVRAFNDYGFSDYTPTIEFVTQNMAPVAPANLRNDAPDARSVRIRWDDVANSELGYRVAISTDGVHFTNIEVTGPDARSVTLRELKPNTRYWVKVRAFNDIGFSDYTSVLQFRTARS